MSYAENKQRAITRDNTPTMTDQSAAKDTDINVIVAQFTIHGQVPGNPGQPMYEDFTQLPTDLREFINQARSLDELHSQLPDSFKKLALNDLFSLTNEQILNTLTPAQPAPTPDTPA